MKSFVILILIFLFSFSAFAQKPAKKKSSAAPKVVVNVGNEKEEFEKAVAVADASERIAALQKFIENFPASAEKIRAQELIVSARAAIGDEKLRLSDTASGVEFFKLAVKDAPQPMSDKMSALILNFPTNLFWRGQRTEALEIARIIEAKADGNAKQLLGLATFYLGTENAAEAKRIAEKALALDANLPSAYQMLGLGFRLNFQLDESANAYQKALELDTNSIVSRRSLAEMKRATGKADEAAALYREILAKDSADGLAQTGLILSLFGAEKRIEAEAEMSKALQTNPNNLVLLVGAAYWYAAHNEGAKAVELAQKAVEIEPRYTWAHIALARGFLQQKRPLDAERTLLAARQYGNFPTLDYEIASARLQAGFFREAVEILKPNFTISGENVKTNLGGRVTKESTNFTELLALERRASIFEPTAADDAENADKLKALLDFNQKLDSANDAEISLAADEFVKGDDKMRLYRGLFAANLLLQSKKSLPKAMELIQSTVGKADAALEIPNASAAVLADELYESRTVSMSRNQFVIVPNVPRRTLSAILRGRIEEIIGWTFYQQNNPTKASVHLRRAVSVLPDKSAWWRSSMWRLGASLQADGKEKDALDSYIKSYPTDAPDGGKYLIIESLYKKLNGNTEELETKIGVKPASAIFASTETEIVKTPETIAQNTEPANQPTAPKAEIIEPKPESTPTPEIKPEPTLQISPTPVVEATPEATLEVAPTPELFPTPTPETPLQPEIKPEVIIEKPPTDAPLAAIRVLPNPETNPKEITEIKEPETAATKIPSPEKPKPLFEPIIIMIPKSEPLKTINPKITKDADENETKPIDESVGTGLMRPRVIDENPPCSLIVSQENVSLFNGGGSLGVLVGFEKSGDFEEIKAVSSSPKDVEVVFEPEIGALSGRAFFVIKSITEKVGEYKIFFEASCGKKEITVKVR